MPSQDNLCRSFTEDDADLEGYTDPNLPLVALEALLNRPPSRRKRLLHSGLLLLALGVVLITFWGVIVPGKGALLTAAPPAPATLLISSNVTAGTVTINGHQQPGPLPLRVPLPVPLPAQVMLAAPPFRPVTCQLPPTRRPAPGAFAPCLVGSSGSAAAPEVNLRIYLTLNDLPLTQQGQISTVLAQTLRIQQETVVPAQAAFATSAALYQPLTSQRTSAPLWATVFLAPATPADPAFCAGRPCSAARVDPFSRPSIPADPPVPCEESACPNCAGGLCYEATFGPPSLSGQFWEVGVSVRLGWRFRQPTGQVVSRVVFPDSETMRLVLVSDRRGNWQLVQQAGWGWSLSQQLASVVTWTGRSLLALQLHEQEGSVHIAQQRGIVGCEFVAHRNNQDQGTFLWRFGVLLAADAGAQALLPTLPVAAPGEIIVVGG